MRCLEAKTLTLRVSTSAVRGQSVYTLALPAADNKGFPQIYHRDFVQQIYLYLRLAACFKLETCMSIPTGTYLCSRVRWVLR